MRDLNKQYFFHILSRYRLGHASKEEIDFLEAYYKVFENEEDLSEKEQEEIKARVKSRVDQEIDRHEKERRHTGLSRDLLKYAAAAVLLLCLSLGAYLSLRRIPMSPMLTVHPQDVAPGGNRAVLILSSGKKILLDDVANGEIAKEGGISIHKTAEGQIVYTLAAEHTPDAAAVSTDLNTISTPAGGQYQVRLPDGTLVWLNSSSSLKYPASFSGRQRLVELSGEAYFEVTKNKEMPFRIKTGIQTVEVLGTHFNINAYEDEPVMKTTLLEGSVKVSSEKGQTIIKPGQQAKVSRSTAETAVEDHVNIDKAVAWKNGIFSFENDDLKSIMRQISRWYDVKIIYRGSLPEWRFSGEISRHSQLSEVFKILELNNIHFDIDGKTVRVSVSQEQP